MNLPTSYDDMKPPTSTSLGLSTKVRLDLLIAIMPLVAMMVVVWFKMDAVEKSLRMGWTVPQQALWAERLRMGNADLVVPDVELVRKMMRE